MGLFGTAFKLGMNTGKGATHLATSGSKIVEGMSSQAAKEGAKELAEGGAKEAAEGAAKNAVEAAPSNVINTGTNWKTVAAGGGVMLVGHQMLKNDMQEFGGALTTTLANWADDARDSGADLMALAEAGAEAAHNTASETASSLALTGPMLAASALVVVLGVVYVSRFSS